MSNPKQKNCNKSPSSATQKLSTDALERDNSSSEMSSEESVPKQTSSVQHTNLPIHGILGATASHTITQSRLNSQKNTNSNHCMKLPFSSGSNFGKKYIHWTNNQIELLSSYLKKHPSFATSPSMDACQLIKAEVFPEDDDVTPKRLFGKICNMKAAYKRSGGDQNIVLDSFGRRRQKRRHVQMDPIYKNFESRRELSKNCKQKKPKYGSSEGHTMTDDNPMKESFNKDNYDMSKCMSKSMTIDSGSHIFNAQEDTLVLPDRKPFQTVSSNPQDFHASRKLKSPNQYHNSNRSLSSMAQQTYCLSSIFVEPCRSLFHSDKKIDDLSASHLLKEFYSCDPNFTQCAKSCKMMELSKVLGADFVSQSQLFDVEKIEQEISLIQKQLVNPANINNLYHHLPELQYRTSNDLETNTANQNDKTLGKSNIMAEKTFSGSHPDPKNINYAFKNEWTLSCQKSLDIMEQINKCLMSRFEDLSNKSSANSDMNMSKASISGQYTDNSQQDTNKAREFYAKASIINSYTETLLTRFESINKRKSYVEQLISGMDSAKQERKRYIDE